MDFSSLSSLSPSFFSLDMETNDDEKREREFSFPRLVVIFVLLSSRPRNLLSYLVFFTPTKRYQEVDGVRKEKERLTTDFSSLWIPRTSTFICYLLPGH